MDKYDMRDLWSRIEELERELAALSADHERIIASWKAEEDDWREMNDRLRKWKAEALLEAAEMDIAAKVLKEAALTALLVPYKTYPGDQGEAYRQGAQDMAQDIHAAILELVGKEVA